MLMTIAQTLSEPSMGAGQGLQPQLKIHYGKYTHTHTKHSTDIPENSTKVRETKAGQDTGVHALTENGSLCPTDFQTDKLSVGR